jgi:hypothetical protein
LAGLMGERATAHIVQQREIKAGAVKSRLRAYVPSMQ